MSLIEVTKLLKGKKDSRLWWNRLLGKSLAFIGAVGFDIGHIYLIVRSRKRSDGSIRQSSEARFWSEIATSGALDPIRRYSYKDKKFTDFLNEKISPIDGDVKEFAGVSAEIRNELRGKVDLLLNSAGIVDFNPPLDKSLDANAFGMQDLVALAKDLGDIKFLHTSTCYVAGDRTGQVDEVSPLMYPFQVDDLDIKHWDPDQEIKECMDMVTHASVEPKMPSNNLIFLISQSRI